METISYLLSGFANSLSGGNLLFCFIGVVVGMLVGVLPGLGPTAGTALLLPLSFGMTPMEAIILLSGIYYGAMYGGTITSVLINTPGESASVITCLDGYPLAKQGRAGAALGVAAIGSFVGGLIALIGLILIGPKVASYALAFGPPEFFCLMLLGLTMVVSLLGKDIVKGLIVGFLGLILSMVGTAPSGGIIRFTLGSDYLMSGMDFVAIAMGAFGLAEIFENLEEDMSIKKVIPKIKGFLPYKEERGIVSKAIGRASILGFLIGLIPGTNSVIPAVMSYSMEKRLSKHPEKFGTGVIEGVAGPETANNSYCGGAMVPLFTLGIPTSPPMAVLMGAFIMHGVTPGPTMFTEHADIAWTVIASMMIGNMILVILNLPLAGVWAQITRVPSKILFPIIVIIAMYGVYGLNNRMFDVSCMIVFGIVAYFLKKADFSMTPFLLTYILGEQMETSLVQSMTIFRGDFAKFFTRPICAVLLVLVVVIMVVGSLTQKHRIEKFGSDDVEV